MAEALKSTFTFVGNDGREVPALRNVNPDGKLGGWVATTAKVDPTAIIEAGALVEPEAKVPANMHVMRGQVIAAPAP